MRFFLLDSYESPLLINLIKIGGQKIWQCTFKNLKMKKLVTFSISHTEMTSPCSLIFLQANIETFFQEKYEGQLDLAVIGLAPNILYKNRSYSLYYEPTETCCFFYFAVREFVNLQGNLYKNTQDSRFRIL